MLGQCGAWQNEHVIWASGEVHIFFSNKKVERDTYINSDWSPNKFVLLWSAVILGL